MARCVFWVAAFAALAMLAGCQAAKYQDPTPNAEDIAFMQNLAGDWQIYDMGSHPDKEGHYRADFTGQYLIFTYVQDRNHYDTGVHRGDETVMYRIALSQGRVIGKHLWKNEWFSAEGKYNPHSDELWISYLMLGTHDNDGNLVTHREYLRRKEAE